MPKPDWNAKQKPEQKSPHHGKKDKDHGPHEHGLGGEKSPEERGPKQSPEDLAALEPEEGEPIVGLVDTITSASAYAIKSTPPVQDQGTSPRCVAYSNAYDQNQHDRVETGQFWNFDEAKFFAQIGGTSAGAFMTEGLKRRRDYGYPEAVNTSGQDGNPNYSRHKIASYTQVALSVTSIKAALAKGHGVLFIGDWFHSWFHPLASGKLPAPDYKVGGHAVWCRGWNDTYGFRFRNSWGTDYGISGDFYLPYAFLSRFYAAYRTTDQ